MNFFLSLLGSGYCRPCSGTVASVVSIIILWLLDYNLSLAVGYKLLVWAIIFIILYLLSLKFIAQATNSHDSDPSWIVIDEFLGMMVAYLPLLFLPYTWWHLVFLVILFRFFDIVKPWGIKQIDNQHSAWSVIVDDLIAGVYAAILLWLIIIFIY